MSETMAVVEKSDREGHGYLGGGLWGPVVGFLFWSGGDRERERRGLFC